MENERTDEFKRHKGERCDLCRGLGSALVRVCQESAESGQLCTRKITHKGPHVSCSFGEHCIEVWD